MVLIMIWGRPSIKAPGRASDCGVPTMANAPAHGFEFEAVRSRDNGNATAIRKFVLAGVQFLLGGRRPTAVVWRIRTVNINAINGQVVSVSVGKSPRAELCKALPDRTNPNSAPAVVRPRTGLRVIAPCLHPAPYFEQARSRHAVRCSPFRCSFNCKTSARPCVPAAQSITGNSRLRAALATAHPRNIGLYRAAALKHQKTPECAAGEVNHCASRHSEIVREKRKGGWA